MAITSACQHAHGGPLKHLHFLKQHCGQKMWRKALAHRPCALRVNLWAETIGPKPLKPTPIGRNLRPAGPKLSCESFCGPKPLGRNRKFSSTGQTPRTPRNFISGAQRDLFQIALGGACKQPVHSVRMNGESIRLQQGVRHFKGQSPVSKSCNAEGPPAIYNYYKGAKSTNVLVLGRAHLIVLPLRAQCVLLRNALGCREQTQGPHG